MSKPEPVRSSKRSTAFASIAENDSMYSTHSTGNDDSRRSSKNKRKRLSSFAIIHNMKVFGVPKKQELEKRTRHRVYFSSGSDYEGEWDNLGLSGQGDYNYPHGVNYHGTFFDGLFDALGILNYPRGQFYTDFFSQGAESRTFEYRFRDDLVYVEYWNYCCMPDRRFQISITNGFNPAGKEHLTNDEKAREIPENCYDVGDGFFDPRLKVVFSPSNRQKILRIPTPNEEEWIIKNCRKAWDEPTRYRPDLYEKWVTGRSWEDNEYFGNYYTHDDRGNSYEASEDLTLIM